MNGPCDYNVEARKSLLKRRDAPIAGSEGRCIGCPSSIQ
jgi:hypothetical protein